jgi:hypothetical protein
MLCTGVKGGPGVEVLYVLKLNEKKEDGGGIKMFPEGTASIYVIHLLFELLMVTGDG